MASRYETGSRDKVIRSMVYYAVRDQEALADAHTPPYGEPDDDAKQVIEDCMANIRDFKRLARTLLGDK